MTIADDMRAASLGELARTKAQLKTANDEIEQLRGVVMKDQEALTAAEAATLELRRELTDERFKAFQAQERSKDLARQLDKTNEQNAADLDVLSSIQYELDRMTAMRDQWKRIAIAYRSDRNTCAGEYGVALVIRVWSEQRRRERAAIDERLREHEASS